MKSLFSKLFIVNSIVLLIPCSVQEDELLNEEIEASADTEIIFHDVANAKLLDNKKRTELSVLF